MGIVDRTERASLSFLLFILTVVGSVGVILAGFTVGWWGSLGFTIGFVFGSVFVLMLMRRKHLTSL